MDGSLPIVIDACLVIQLLSELLLMCQLSNICTRIVVPKLEITHGIFDMSCILSQDFCIWLTILLSAFKYKHLWLNTLCSF